MTRARLVVVGAAVALVVAVLTVVARSSGTPDLILQIQPIADDTTVTVYVGGAVEASGLYTLPRGARVADALGTAVVLPDADTTGLPMAGKLTDGQQVTVPRRAPVQATPAVGAGQAATPIAAGPINVNTATVAELDTLPGIGPALAQRIVTYRTEHGPFPSVDALDQVSGISARMVEALRGRVTVGG